MNLVLADTSVWIRQAERSVAEMIAAAIRAGVLATVLPVTLELLRSARDANQLESDAQDLDALHQIELTRSIGTRAREVQQALAVHGYHRVPSPTEVVAAAAAEAVKAELWHCDRHFELIAEVTGQPVRRLGR